MQTVAFEKQNSVITNERLLNYIHNFFFKVGGQYLSNRRKLLIQKQMKN